MNFKKYIFVYLAFVVLITLPLLIYYKSLNNQFVNWDDRIYITGNDDVNVFTQEDYFSGVLKIFETYTLGNYHPFTMLSYAVDYYFNQTNAKAYHVSNLLLHLFNTLLVFYFIFLLSRQRITALLTALLFAVHPMHVESVAWVAERKGVLYTFFYLSGLCAYLHYLNAASKKQLLYLFTLLLFVFSLLSKGMAVSFSLVLFIIDYYMNRKITRDVMVEKIPFLILSVLFGVIAIVAQKHGNALDIADYNFFERILFSSYGLLLYTVKAFIPIHLSCMYSYPVKQDGWYPVVFYLSPLLVVLLTYLIFKLQLFKQQMRWGVLFFIATIVLVLQLLPVGASLISERYTYVPYIGLFFLMSYVFNYFIEKNKNKDRFKAPAVLLMCSYLAVLSFAAYSRTKVWHDGITLWTDAIKKDSTNPLFYDNRASSFYLLKKNEQALADLNKALELGIEDDKLFFRRATVLYELNRYNDAIVDFNKAEQLNSFDTIIFYKRAYAYAQTKQYNLSLEDYNRILALSPQFSDAYHDRGLVYFNTQQYDKAIADFTKAIQLKADFAVAYLSRGAVNFVKGNIHQALTDYTLAIQYAPDYADAYYNRVIAYLAVKDFENAHKDILKLKELNYPLNPDLVKDVENGWNAVKSN